MSERRADLLVLAAILLLIAATFGHGVRHRATTLDDEAIVFANPAQQHFGLRELREAFDPRVSRVAYGLQYTPLRDVSHAIDVRLFGDDAGLHHVQSLLLHLVATAALFALVRRLGGSTTAAAVAALVFGVHPLQVESVAWISGRTVPLAGALTLCALVAWRRARTRGDTGAWMVALALFVLANLSKQSAVVTIGMMAAVEWTVRPSRRGWIAAYAPFAILALGFAVVGMAIARREGIVLPDDRSLTEQIRLSLSAAGWYAAAIVWPVGLLPAYHLAPPARWVDPAVLRGVLVLGIAALASVLATRLAVFGIAVAVLAMLPGVHGLGTQVVADRYAYLVIAGVAVSLGVVADGLRQRAPRLAVAAVTTLGVVLAATAYARVGVWYDDVALFGDALATEPDRPLWLHMHGRALADAGRPADARVAMNEARARTGGGAVDGYCALPSVLTEIGLQREREGDLAGAEEALVSGLEDARSGEIDRAGVDLGGFYLRRGDRQRARLAYLRAVERSADEAPLSRARAMWVAALDAEDDGSHALPGHGLGAHNAAMAKDGPAAGGGTGGVVYNDPGDRRLIVPKRIGYGWTINFAHPWAIPALIGFFLLAVGPSMLLLWSGYATPIRFVVVEAISIGLLILLAMRAARG